MTKYLLLYRATTSARDQMASATPEQAQAGMDAWTAWAERAGSAVLDLGAPMMTVSTVGDGAARSGSLGGYSLVETESADALDSLLDGHPHLMMDGAAIEVCELLSMPGS